MSRPIEIRCPICNQKVAESVGKDVKLEILCSGKRHIKEYGKTVYSKRCKTLYVYENGKTYVKEKDYEKIPTLKV